MYPDSCRLGNWKTLLCWFINIVTLGEGHRWRDYVYGYVVCERCGCVDFEFVP